MNEAIDISALNWIQQELGETLKQGRVYLEAYADGDADSDSLNSCMACLHEARGPLRLVELSGADQLATEMEEVINDLLHDRIGDRSAALEAVMQAFIQLPDYLFSLRSRRRENAAVLVPLVNGLRGVRGASALPDPEVFSPGLDIDLPASAYAPQQAAAQPEAADVARVSRQRFQSGLLEWYRDGNAVTGLRAIAGVIDALRRASRQLPAARFWWVAGAFTETLLENPQAVDNRSRQLLGQVDRQIKCLIDTGEAEFAGQIPDALLLDLLQQVAASNIGYGLPGAVRKAYALDRQAQPDVPAEDTLGGRSPEVLKTITDAALVELRNIRESLDGFARNPGQDAGLLAVIEDLHALANTLEISGINDSAGTVAGVIRQLREISSDGGAAEESAMAGIAASLVAVETSIRNMHLHELVQESESSTASLVRDEGLDALVREVINDMTQAKEHINSYLRRPESPGDLSGVPGLLHQVQGGLQLAGQERAADLVARISGYIDSVMVRGGTQPDADRLDTLADAICAVEYYVEEFGQDRLHGGMALDLAEQSMDRLEEVPQISAATEVPEAGATQASAHGTPATACREAPVISGLQVLGSDVDPEILEIFIEECAGEIVELSRLVSGWVADTENRELLETMLRVFHTLKGNGRMVGALALAEFAWTFEHLLKQVADGVLAVDARVLELLLDTGEPLTQLLAQVRDGAVPETDNDAIVARAMTLLAPESSGDPGVVTTVVKVPDAPVVPVADDAVLSAEAPDGAEPVSVPAAGMVPEAEELPALVTDADPEIVEIFLEEAQEILEEISGHLSDWLENSGNVDALAGLRRCFHTLKGSGRMAGAMRTGEFSRAVENLLNRVLDGSVTVDASLTGLVEQSPVYLAGLIEEINGGPPADAGYRELMQAAEQLALGEQPEFQAWAAAGTMNVTEPGVPVTAADNTPDAGDPEAELPEIQEIYRRESAQHLGVIRAFVKDCDAVDTGCPVSESLYRAIHTLAGISESAEAPAMHRIAAALYACIGGLQENDEPVRMAAVEVMRKSCDVMEALVTLSPDQGYDADLVDSLVLEIGSLPVETPQVFDTVNDAAPEADSGTGPAESGEPVAGCATDDRDQSEQHAVPGVDAGGADGCPVTGCVTEPAEMPATGVLAGVDPELMEIFIEESTDILDNSETTLRAWQDDRGNRELIDEFQRLLHTIKGGARMLEISPIGDLSHSVESLMTRVVDGHVTVSDALFDCLNEAHDALVSMLDQVKAGAMPAGARQLERLLDGFAREPEVVTPEVGTAEVGTAEVGTPEVGAADTGEPAVAAPDAVETQMTDTGEVQATAPETLQEPGTPEEYGADESASSQSGDHVAVTAPPQPYARVPEAVAPQTVVPLPAAGLSGVAPATVREGEVMPRQEERRKATRVRADQVRIQAELLDNLVNNAGEISIYRSRMEQQFTRFRFNIDELQQTIGRLRDQMRQLEIETETQVLYRFEKETGDGNAAFDPLEMDRYSNLQQLSRSLMESIGDLDSIRDLLDNTMRESESLLLQQSRVTADLQDGLLHTRMIPFASLAPRLRRIVRQAAKELGKRVELQLEGAEGEMDRTVIERIIAPLEHMLRNAVDHGIEKSSVRVEAGKPATGTISIGFHREGPEIVLRITDDGHGMDRQAIHDRAVQRGLISGESTLSDDEVLQFVLQSGFSTAREITQISGRGVGLDVVNSAVRQLGGSLHIDTIAGKGSIFTMRLPYTLAVNQALLVRAGRENFCIPLGTIEGVVRVAPDVLASCHAAPEPVYEYAGNTYQLRHLGSLLDTGGLDYDRVGARLPVLLIRAGEKRVALQVEELHGNREIVVKPLGVQFSHVNGISGATILGDGRVVLILDLAAVIRMEARRPAAAKARSPEQEAKLTVMVVDDSITVRKVTTRLLQNHGFKVLTAKDGIDAMGQLQERVPDLMLLDIEMPRMDGFELATHMRNDERFRHVPITMITSRTGDKHRNRARDIGITHYLGKPYQEKELLESIYGLIGLPYSAQTEYRERADG